MSDSLVDRIAEAVLYEGYILYPYRASSAKNRERFTFGRVYPRCYSVEQNGAEPCVMQTECLARSDGDVPSVAVRVRFLHPMAREIGAARDGGDDVPPEIAVVPDLTVDGQTFRTWHEAVEREICLQQLPLSAESARETAFSFPEVRTIEPIRDHDGRVAGWIRRRQAALAGTVELRLDPLEGGAWRIGLRVSNDTPLAEPEERDADAVLLRTFASAHAILRLEGAEFLSLMDPPPEYAEAAVACANTGVWPVLVGDEEKGQRDTMLASPIILYDYPKIAAESPGDLCDGTEIDEILTLRVMTMTDAEKLEMRGVDACARRILERTESLGESDLLQMHGAMREVQFPGDFFDPNTRLDQVCVDGVSLKTGDRVRICPKQRADAMDLILKGRIAVIEAIEQDAEGQAHFALVLEDDPGRDLGMMRQPGHRFFYGAGEVEPVTEAG